MSDKNEAAAHPWKVTSTTFLLVWLAVTPYTDFRADHRNLVVSVLLGAAFGLMVALLCLGMIGQLRGWPAWINGRPGQMLRPPIGLTALWAGAGLGVIWGVTTGSFQLALIGLPLIALGLFCHLIKRSLLP